MKRQLVVFATEKHSFFVALEYQFKQYGIEVFWEEDPGKVIRDVRSKHPVAVILSSFPGNGELTDFHLFRGEYSGPLLVVAEKADIQFQILTLQLGADGSWNVTDGVALVAAQIHALLRRSGAFDLPERVEAGNLVIDRKRREGFLSGKPLMLSTMEFQLLWLLVVQRGKVVSRHEIHQELYDDTYNGFDRSIDLYISRIRQKIGDKPLTPRYLKTIRGTGYQFIACD